MPRGMAGMPVGPLALTDETAIDLAQKIMKQTIRDLGEKAVDPAQMALIDTMVDKHGRFGRKNGKGFYDYPPKPAKKKLWPGLKDLYPQLRSRDRSTVEELKQRFLVTIALEAARVMEEGIVTDPREADVGSILAFGFAPFTGGTLSYIDGIGAKKFVKIAKALQKKYGAAVQGAEAACSTWRRRARPSTSASTPTPRRRGEGRRPEPSWRLVWPARQGERLDGLQRFRRKVFFPVRIRASHALASDRVWAAIDALAERYSLSASGLAKRAGLDSTAFNKSKRLSADGRPRWPSTEVDRQDHRGDRLVARRVPGAARWPAGRAAGSALGAQRRRAAARLRAGRRRRLLRRCRLSGRPGLGPGRASGAGAETAPMRCRCRAIPCCRSTATATC